jgi:tRNA(Ile)-lysidine synthase
VVKILTRYSMLAKDWRLGVAVSGGADSVVLLRLLHELAQTHGLHLHVLHVNHGLRGAESDGDQEFVEALAKQLGWPCSVTAGAIPPGNIEEEARRIRRRFFFEQMEAHQLGAVALGHTASDQAETILFRFLRGTGTRGLAGLRTYSPERLVRPLLGTTRAEIRDWATANGLSWREDASNDDHRFTRNRLRLETIPALRSYNPQLERVLGNMAEIAQTEEDYWDGETSKAVGAVASHSAFGTIVSVSKLRALHVALQRRVLRQLGSEIRDSSFGLDVEHVESIRRLCDGKGGHNRVLVPGIDSMRSFDALLMTHPETLKAHHRFFACRLTIGSASELPMGGSLCLQALSSDLQNCANFKDNKSFHIESADLSVPDPNGTVSELDLQVRNWQPGDQFQPGGRSEAEKLKTLFQEFRIPLWERRHWPVLIWNDQIVWSLRFGVAAEFLPREDPGPGTRGVSLRLTYAGPLGLATLENGSRESKA